jgi:phosphoserine phosphatase
LVAAVIKEEGEAIGKTELYGKKIAKGLAARPAVAKLIGHLQKQGVKIWVVSASPRLLVAEAMKHFGVSAELIGIRHKIIDGVIVPELEYPLSVMGGKVDCIKLFIDPTARPLIGVGDSGNDLPMLEYSSIKAVVDRQNSLSEKAKASGWALL